MIIKEIENKKDQHNITNFDTVKKFDELYQTFPDDDYFEKALELLIKQESKIYPIDISEYFCCEIDTQEDLILVNKEYLILVEIKNSQVKYQKGGFVQQNRKSKTW